ncbi:MAG: hypothetical protein BPHS0_25 [Phage 5P_3]|nr:MAG: hypothetical protein BPHS0_25 [Phage 5P_3]
MTRKVLVCLADTHAGHKLALLNPAAKLLDDSGAEPRVWAPTLTQVQTLLWRWYSEDIAGVAAFAAGAPVIVCHVGDVAWGRKHPDGLVSTRECDQLAIACWNLEPWFALPNMGEMLLVHGTEAHEFGEGSAPIAVAAQLQTLHTDRRVSAGRHYALDVDGAEIDLAHHGPTTGARVWLNGNVLRAYAISEMMATVMAGQRPPAAIVRAHYHDYRHETVRVLCADGVKTCEAVILPSYCGLTHYAAQVTRSAHVLSVGLVALAIEDGKVAEVRPFWRTLDLRTRKAV